MKKQIIPYQLLTSLLLLFGGILQAQNCTISLTTVQNYIVGSAFNIQPGDTVCFEAGNKDFIQLKDIHGTAEQPITFINKGGAVVINTDHYFGIKIGNCSHIIFRGDGVTNLKYGFQVTKVTGGAGLSVDDQSTNVEVSHMEISNTAIGGVYAKTDPTCANYQQVDRDHFTMYNFSLHDCYIHDVADEGMYIGNSHYSGYTISPCNIFVYPHAMKGVFIYNNIVENTGWDGIQVSSADSNCQIYNNTVHFDSQAEAFGQMSGILIGGGSKCKVYNNRVTDGKGDGIEVFGLGNMDIFNNLIVDAGLNFQPGDPTKMKHGIYVGTVITEPNAILGIYNNTIVSPKSFGINLTNTELQKTRIINNLITDPGKYVDNGNKAFININTGISDAQIDTTNNYNSATIAKVQFVNSDGGDFDLKLSSPAVDFGVDLSSEGVTFDILGRSRPYHTNFDAGAFENHDPIDDVGYIFADDVGLFKIFPNPAHRQLNINYQIKTAQNVQVAIIDLVGKELIHKIIVVANSKTCIYKIDLPIIPNGLYFIKMETKKGVSVIPFIIKQ